MLQRQTKRHHHDRDANPHTERKPNIMHQVIPDVVVCGRVVPRWSMFRLKKSEAWLHG